MATLVATEGSSPRSTGSRMWVDEAGRIVGSVTIGGCVDARVIEASTRALENGEPALLTMALGDEDAWAIGMTCAGTIEVLVEPVDPADPVARALGVASDEVDAGRTAVIVAPLSGAPSRLGARRSRSTTMSIRRSSHDNRDPACDLDKPLGSEPRARG